VVAPTRTSEVSAFAPISIDKRLRCTEPKNKLKPIGDASYTGRRLLQTVYAANRIFMLTPNRARHPLRVLLRIFNQRRSLYSPVQAVTEY